MRCVYGTALKQRGWCEPADLITHHMDYTDVQKAYDMYGTQQNEIIKVIIDINK